MTTKSANQGTEYGPQGSGDVVIMLQSSDPDVLYLGLLYANNAIQKQWMDNVKIVFWGPAQKTLTSLPDDSDQMKLVKSIQAQHGQGSRIWACKACSERLGITEKMEKLGFEVFHVGNATSDLLKLGYRMWNW